MRIGIDMLAVQSPESRGRGIGRYALELTTALVKLDTESEYVFYAHHGQPTDSFPRVPNAHVRHLPKRETAAIAIDEVTRQDPDRLDALLLLSPFELHESYAPPARPLAGPALASILYDLIPFLFQEQYMTWPPSAARFYRNLERLRRYDALLAISEATRDDGRRLLGLGSDRIISISGASDPTFFTPDPDGPASAASQAILNRLGIAAPFVFCLGSMDDRKNLRGLIDAFALLPEQLRETRQLVITFAIRDDEARTIREYARARHVEHRLVLTGGVSDEDLRCLYRRCDAFAFPSLYEGFGLPLLEAMLCGAVVLGGNNSSQPEVVGDAGLLANASDSADISEKLAMLLTDRALTDRLRNRGREQSQKFRWEASAAKARDVLHRIVQPRVGRVRKVRVDAGQPSRPRIAVFSPWPPKRSGISDYAERLVRELTRWYAIDLYHDPGYLPDLALRNGEFGCYDARLFRRQASVRGYRGILYQMGNSLYHRYVYENLLAHSGIVTLHDFCLSGFHAWYAHHVLDDLRHFHREVEHTHPDQAASILASLDDWSLEMGGIGDACARRGLHLSRRVFDHAEAVIVHSPAVRDRAARLHPDRADRLHVIPHGSEVKTVPEATRQATRRRHGLPAEALIFATFGIMHPTKLNVETVEAFAPIARERPDAMLLFVGEDQSGLAVRDRADELGLATRVRVLGRQPAEAFEELLGTVDVGISLRKPPTNGETSGALLHLLRHGIPCVVNDAGTFGEYPDDVVLKVRWESVGIEGLTRALRQLADDRSARALLGLAARRRIDAVHDWSKVASQYAQLIEASAERRGRTRVEAHRGPHFSRRRVASRLTETDLEGAGHG